MRPFLFIFESIGTSELILIGIVALIFLGPRRLPEIARKVGKVMADLRSTTNEFKQTWEREVNFEEESKALRSAFDETPVPRASGADAYTEAIAAPEIKQVDASAFHGDIAQHQEDETASIDAGTTEREDSTLAPETALSEKKDWL